MCLTEVQANIDNLHNFRNMWDKISRHHRYLFWNTCEDNDCSRGYSGTAIFTSARPERAVFGFCDLEPPNTEGRVITLVFKDVTVIGVYSPSVSIANAKRFQYRLDFDRRLASHAALFRKEQPVILCGDFNVSHTDQD